MSFQYKSDAELVYELLKKRMKHFGLSLEEKKTRLIEFGRFAEANRAKRGETKPETFDFLGFTHYCSHGKNGKFRVKRKTSRKKFSYKCKEVHKLIGEMRTLPVKVIVKKLNQILVGYYHYYGITDNSRSITNILPIQGDEEPVLLDEQKKSEKKLPMEWISGHAYKGISTS